MNRAVFAAAALVLSACGSEGGQYQAMTSSPGIAEPGAFRESITTRVDAPGIEPRLEEERNTHCLKGGGDPVRRKLVEQFERLCVNSTLRFEEGFISGEADCLWSTGATERMRVSFSGSYQDNRVELVSEARVPEGSVRQTRIFERTGACLTQAEAIDDAVERNDWSIAENREAAR